MKKNIYVFMAIMFLGISCSKDNNNQSNLSDSELMVQGSPWEFNRYELIEIIEPTDSALTKSEIEIDVNNLESIVSLQFNEDGTGSSIIFGSNFNWKIIDGDLIFSFVGNGNNIESEIFKNFQVSQNELSFELSSITFDSENSVEVLHYGTYFFE